MKKILFLIFSLFSVSFFSQTLSTSLTACYALDGNATEPINALTGTLSAVTPTLDRFNNPNSALYLNGTTSSYIMLPDDPLLKPTNAISFSAWIKPSILPTTTSYVLYTNNGATSNFESYSLNYEFMPLSASYHFRIHKGNGGITDFADCTTPIAINTWYHVAFTIDNTSLILYINGVLEASAPSTLAFTYVTGKKVFMGVTNEPAYNLPFAGSIDNARFYNRVLTATEVNQLFLTDPSCSPTNLNCNTSFYSLVGNNIYECSLSVPNTSTLTGISIPVGASGLAIAPSFGFPAPNPTFWTTLGSTYWYYNGTSFINTNHFTGSASAINPGGSKNFIYNTDGTSGQVYKYNGTGNATLTAIIPAIASSGPYDLTGDDQDNFYYLITTAPQSLNVYNSSGVLTCSYSVNGYPLTAAGGGISIVGNTVTAHDITNYHVGTISGNTINFTTTASSFGIPSDFANCYIDNSFTSSITANPSASLTCLNSTITLTANTAPSALSYTWAGPGILTSLNNQSVQVNAAGVYTCTISTATTCPVEISVSTFTVYNNAILSTSITSSPASNTICSGQSATLAATGATSYTWNPGGFTTSSVIVTPTTSTTYTLLSINGVCSSTNTIPVSVNPTPTINSTSNPTAICVGGSATLTASGATNYTWNPVALSGSSVIVSPTITTTYTVLGMSSAGCSNTKTINLVVNSNPTITATANPTNICSASGASATLTANGASTYTWNPGSLAGNTVVVTPTTTTVYTVTGTNSSNCTSTQTVSILITPTPTLNVAASSTAICRGASATLTAIGAGTFTWFPGAQTSASVVVSPTATTIYTIVGGNGICTSSKTHTLIVLPRPNVSITTFPPVICSGTPALLIATGATNYTWHPGSSNGNTLVVLPFTTTSYTVVGTNAAGCTNTAALTVTVNPTPTISVVPSSNSVCAGNSVTLNSTGGLTYVVNPGLQNGASVIVSPTVTTTYSVTGVSASGCTDTEMITINVIPGPVINATSSGTLLCEGATFSLSANGATNYTWMPVGLNGSTLAAVATASVPVYTVFGESNGCISTFTLPVQVINCNNNVFGMTKAAGKPVLIYNTFYNVDFTVTAVNASSLSLTSITLNENLASAFPSPSNFTVVNQPVVTSHNSGLVVNPLFDGISQISLTTPLTSTLLPHKRDTLVFTVRIDPKGYYGPFKNWVVGFATVLNNFTVADSSNNGFLWDPDGDGDPTNNDTATVINLPFIDLFIPDGFSPNGDNKNDFFFIKGLNNRPVKLTIFNRWGNKVYEKPEYDNSWNGYPNVANTIGSGKVPPGTYYYIIEFQDGDKDPITGFVVVQY